MRTPVAYANGYVVYQGKKGFFLRKVGSEKFEQIYYQSMHEAVLGARILTEPGNAEIIKAPDEIKPIRWQKVWQKFFGGRGRERKH
jgi:hypothetical protein